MKLIVGLGNPGREYEDTRHNAGFWLIDRLAEKLRVPMKSESRFHGLVGRTTDNGHECWLLKPTTYMNDSGRSVAALSRFYKIEPQEILVVHDELDLPPGTVKMKKGGGSAGHNGLKDVTANIGADYWRLRLGIAHPGDRDVVIDYVLKAPRREERELIDAAIDKCIEVWPQIAAGRTEAAMLKLHTKPAS